jgi:hypothetical protein
VQVDQGSTVQEHVPPNETGQVPVSLQRSEPHWFGVAPPELMLSVAVVAFIFAIVLFAIGHWPFGLILLGAGALLLAAFLEAARRRPQAGMTRASVEARERARSSWDTLRARQVAVAEARRIRSALMLLEPDRSRALQELGTAAYAGDTAAEAAVRDRLTELETRVTGLRAELDEVHGQANERIRKAQLPVQETQLVPPEPQPGDD